MAPAPKVLAVMAPALTAPVSMAPVPTTPAPTAPARTPTALTKTPTPPAALAPMACGYGIRLWLPGHLGAATMLARLTPGCYVTGQPRPDVLAGDEPPGGPGAGVG
jgi:hypothetical protein